MIEKVTQNCAFLSLYYYLNRHIFASRMSFVINESFTLHVVVWYWWRCLSVRSVSCFCYLPKNNLGKFGICFLSNTATKKSFKKLKDFKRKVEEKRRNDIWNEMSFEKYVKNESFCRMTVSLTSIATISIV